MRPITVRVADDARQPRPAVPLSELVDLIRAIEAFHPADRDMALRAARILAE